MVPISCNVTFTVLSLKVLNRLNVHSTESTASEYELAAINAIAVQIFACIRK